jgi:5-methylthioribose kinase
VFTHIDLLKYLLRRKIITAESVIDGNLRIIEASRRNHNFGILSKHSPSYLLKQGVDSARRATVANEAKLYELFHPADGVDAFAHYVPACLGYDLEEHVLVLEFLLDLDNLQRHHMRCGRFSKTIAASIGDALGLLHSSWRAQLGNEKSIPICARPWVFSIHRPDMEVLRGMSEATIQVIKIVQRNPEFCARLDDLQRQWKSEALIHGDFKWDHCFVPVRGRQKILKIVDWELAGLGDPAWDIGSVFGSYLSFWLLFLPMTTDTPPLRSVSLARYPLERMQPAISSFWLSYARRAKLASAKAEQLLLRSVKYAAVRMTQDCYEQTQASPHLLGNTVCLVQLAVNILERPEQACGALLGFKI